jgi:hypothetical protein
MLKPTAIAAVLALSASSLAVAQTSPPTSPTSPPTSPRAAPPAGGATGGSGSTRPPRELTEADIKPGLEGLGYSDVTEVKQARNGFTAKAKRDGQPVELEIDRSGRVAQKQ